MAKTKRKKIEQEKQADVLQKRPQSKSAAKPVTAVVQDPLAKQVEQFQEQIRQAVAAKQKLRIVGGNSKSWYGNSQALGQAQELNTSAYGGIIEYEPTELFIRVRAGTRLDAVQRLLDQHGQMFAFEPPRFADTATIGGMVSAGLSGPRRAYAAAIKDHVLGVTMLNGRAELLRFGAKVIKNVAGYDISRLMVGALGSLGLLLDVTLKVVPKPQAESSVIFAMSEVDALHQLNRWAGQALPISASCYHAGRLSLRLSGAQAAVKAAQDQLGGQVMLDDRDFWTSVREQQHHFFLPEPDLCLWRLSLPSTAPALPLRSKSLIEWGGAQRWLWTHEDMSKIKELAQRLGGHATMFRYAPADTEVFTALPSAIAKIEDGLRLAFDPHAVFQLHRTAGRQSGVN